MKSILILVVLVFTSVLAQNYGGIETDQSDDGIVAAYFGLKWRPDKEIPMRQEIFRKNLNVVKSHNYRFATGRETFKMGLNEFSDWTGDELKNLLGYISTDTAAPTSSGFNYVLNGVQIVNTLNRPLTGASNNQQGVIGDVQTMNLCNNNSCCGKVLNQGQCVSCYAFSVVQALDLNRCLQCNQSSPMSSAPQNIVDCCTGTSGCNGGWMSTATDCIQKAGGIDPESAYPYTAAQGTCKYNSSVAQHKQVTGYVQITSKSEIDMMQAIRNNQAICAALAVGQAFQMYKSGVLSKQGCTAAPLNHAVLVVGYGKTVTGVLYWIIKNSWGPNWGENGYIRIERGFTPVCCAGICSAAGYPTFNC